MNNKKDTIQPSPDIRTPKFYDFLRSQGKSEEEIQIIKTRVNGLGPDDSLSAYFIHEAANALSNIVLGTQLNTTTPDDYVQSKAQLLNVRRGLTWFTQVGPIPKKTIEAFITEAESLGEWNQPNVEKLFTKFKEIKAKHKI
jgi:hypothetical protein